MGIVLCGGLIAIAKLGQLFQAREISEVINSGIQPIQNLSVMNKVSEDPAKRVEWSKFWIHKGLQGKNWDPSS